jgi:hypothetical protein
MLLMPVSRANKAIHKVRQIEAAFRAFHRRRICREDEVVGATA